MAKKERRGSPAARLEGLYDAGDWRAARAEALRLRDGPGERALADAGLERMRPDASAVWAAAAGLALLVAVALLGLFLR